jgi:uncharacterized protein YxeA
MWIFWLVAIALLVAVVGAVFAGGIFTIVAVPLGLVLAALFVANTIRRGEEAPQVVQQREPTGTPRSSTSGAETANERVGQS